MKELKDPPAPEPEPDESMAEIAGEEGWGQVVDAPLVGGVLCVWDLV